MVEETDIFTKMTDREKQRLFKDLTAIRGDVLCKGSLEEIYRLVAERTTPPDQLLCSVHYGMPVPEKETELFGNFYLGGERYFFRTPVYVQSGLVHLKTNVDVFHLQRRQNYRIKIPANYPAHLLMNQQNGITFDSRAQLMDLSCGGCKLVVEYDKPTFEVADRIMGVLHIGRRDSIDIEGTIRHYKMEKTATQVRQYFGLEFKPLPPLLEGKLYAMTMDLHREFFSLYRKS